MGYESEKAALAKKYFTDGYNCAQAVALAFVEESGLTKDALLKLTASFGGGMGRLREVCGAVSAMFMIAGLRYGYIDPLATDDKADHYKLVQELAALFKKETGTIICRELLDGVASDGYVPDARTAEYYNKRPCADLVYLGASLTARLIQHKG